jgi:dTDP-4-dehydrorhamnose reductase
MRKILVTGGSGQVGSAVVAAANTYGFDVMAPPRGILNLENREEIAALVAAQPWAAVINCAAYTAVDKAENDAMMARAINTTAPGYFAAETAKHGIPLVHVSTDYVFDGTKSAPYDEGDSVRPLGVYGASKEAGEAVVRAHNPNHAIVRTAWVVSANGANFINTMLRLSQERDELGVVNDQCGNPSSATDIAAALLTVADKMTSGQMGPTGTWHFVNSGDATWHDLAQFVFAEAAARGFKTPVLNAIPTSAYPTPARRPENSRLSTAKFQQDFGTIPRHWHIAIADILADRLGPKQDIGVKT